MTAETLTLNPIVDLAALIPSGSAALSFAEVAVRTPLDLAPKKPSYGYDEPNEDDDGYDDEDDEEEDDDDDDDDDEEDDDYSYDDEDDYEDDDEEDEEEEEDEDENDDDEEDDDIGYYTRSVDSASQGGRLNRSVLQ